jgi:hypothetical protein
MSTESTASIHFNALKSAVDSLYRNRKYTDKKEKKIFLIYKEIQNRVVAKSDMTNGLLIYGEIFAHFLIY